MCGGDRPGGGWRRCALPAPARPDGTPWRLAADVRPGPARRRVAPLRAAGAGASGRGTLEADRRCEAGAGPAEGDAATRRRRRRVRTGTVEADSRCEALTAPAGRSAPLRAVVGRPGPTEILKLQAFDRGSARAVRNS
jgi:hypothetical protein